MKTEISDALATIIEALSHKREPRTFTLVPRKRKADGSHIYQVDDGDTRAEWAGAILVREVCDD